MPIIISMLNCLKTIATLTISGFVTYMYNHIFDREVRSCNYGKLHCKVGRPALYMLQIFQELVRRSELQPFSPADFSGHWRYLTVRHSMSTGDIMLIVAMHPQVSSWPIPTRCIKMQKILHTNSPFSVPNSHPL